MAKPRVFISSTHFDLKHIRASLEIFVQTLGMKLFYRKEETSLTHPMCLWTSLVTVR